MKEDKNESRWDKLLNIRTMGRDDTHADQYRYPYEPTPYSVLERLANAGYIRKGNILLDYGCGKGRVDFFLSYQTRCKSIGIEYDERIYEKAAENKKDAVSSGRVEIELANAEEFAVSETADCMYFFNPFSVEILRKVMARILESYYAEPRRIQLFFYYPSDEYISYLMTVEELDPFAEDGFEVLMKDVNFAYVEGTRVITDSYFKACPGEIVALVGPSGEGKTTMIRLILGLIRPQEGEAVIVASNGREIVLNAETRHFFAYVPQGNTILSGTIAENMRMVKEDATDEEIIEALKIACAWEFVEKLPDTINSALGERGRGLSEGQAQRISIARAVLRNAPILLLDEATSALDVTTERKVLRNIIEQKPNKTCIVTTHRPSVLNMCQRVYRVMETKVTELDEEESSRMAMDF